MPKLNTLHYKHENLSFNYDVNIDKQGNFTTTIPKEVSEKLMSIGVKLRQNNRHNYGYFHGTSLHELEEKVQKTADKYSKKELIDEKIVFKYAVDTVCSYCKGVSGTLYPNGGLEQDAEGYENGYHWVNGTKSDSYSKGPYSFEIAFEIKKVKTWAFPNGEQSKEYLRLEESDIKDDEILYWLNSLCGLHLNSTSTVKEIEYTKEIGIFFKKMILFIFNINENIRSIFGKEFDLEKIDHNKIPLITDGIQSKEKKGLKKTKEVE